MTPQLQQAIKLLQLSTMELQQEIQEALESNPMLECEEETTQDKADDKSSETTLDGESEPGLEHSSMESSSPSDNNPSETTSDTTEEISSTELPDDLPVDSAWDDIYPSTKSGTGGGDEDFNFDSKNAAEETLADHLSWQLNLTTMTQADKAIAYAIIEALDTNGYLNTSLNNILETVNVERKEPDELFEMDEVLAVLHRVQQFDPPGVAAQDLKECLSIQLKQLAERPALFEESILIIENYLNLLGSRDYAQIMRKTKFKESTLKEIISIIQSLNPYPGESISHMKPEYIVPDVIVRKHKNKWLVELNNESMPKLRINDHYASFIKRSDTSKENTFLRNNLQEAKWFIKSIQSRNETLLKVSTEIINIQKGFFEYGEEAMKPLVLHDIAEIVEMHESTISRVTTQKYMLTPKGIFELKYFFSSHVSTDSGGECSSTAIRAIVKKLVASENHKKPLSDSKIAGVLSEQGIKVARRTIAKYRESLSIPPSNERKRLI